MLESIAYYLLAIYILLSLIAFSKWRELSKERKLRDLVAWSVTGDYCPALDRYSYVRELLFAVLNAQHNCAIPQQYQIAGEVEKQYLHQIIEEFQKDISRRYFCGKLSVIKSKYAVDDDAFFMIQLHDYILAHIDDDKFLNRELAEFVSTVKHPQGQTESTYQLTDIGIVFWKLRYVTHMYCKQCKIVNPSEYPHWYEYVEAPILKCLDAKQYTVTY